MRSPSKLWPVLFLAAAFAILGLASDAFSAEGKPAGKPAGKKPAEAEAKGSSVAALLEDASFHYESAGRRDPFKSLLDLSEKPPPEVPLPPIRKIDLKTVKIAGIVLDDATGNQAMIKAGKESFVVKTGMIIGKNEGEVIEVTLDGIRVVEKFVDFMGRETLKELYIQSRPTEESK